MGLSHRRPGHGRCQEEGATSRKYSDFAVPLVNMSFNHRRLVLSPKVLDVNPGPSGEAVDISYSSPPLDVAYKRLTFLLPCTGTYTTVRVEGMYLYP